MKEALEERLVDEGPIGRGGTAEVHRVRDPLLGRSMAQKVILPSAHEDPVRVARFLEEAQVTAQLQHPGIVPVHALGRREDGRPYFTMKEVRGYTLRQRIAQVHAASGEGRWGNSADGWSLRQLIEVFRRVCETVAYAHSRGVIHRDLKPENIMTGDFGEVLVLDWGLAKVRGQHDLTLFRQKDRAQPSEQDLGLENLTQEGQISGTPVFMPPEQARQQRDQLGPPSDVYSLGAVLYVVLTGVMPYCGTPMEVLGQLVHRPPIPPSERDDRTYAPIPAELEQICRKATSSKPEDRYANAQVLGDEIAAWLEGTRRRERGLSLVDRADRLVPETERLRTEADRLLKESAALLAKVDLLADEREKQPAWDLEDRALAAQREAERKNHEVVQLLHAALTEEPNLAEAHQRLASFHRRRHASAEATGDRAEADRNEVALKAHDRGDHAEYLCGDGALTIHSEPTGAIVRLSRLEGSRRLRVSETSTLGPTPLKEHTLKMGRYLVELEAPGRTAVRYPVWIQRLRHWRGVPPGASHPEPVRLPALEEIDDNEVVVPAGWFTCGSDPDAASCLPRKDIWVGTFALRRFPVTNREYLAYLNDLIDQGQEAEALRNVPRELALGRDQEGAALYGRDERGHFFLQEDADGDLWQPDWPVTMVSLTQGECYAAWMAERSGLPWRIPSEIEWEKAAVGTDARRFPWGDGFDPTWCNMGQSRRPHRLLENVGSFPRDCSPYGVRDLAGNSRDACYTAPSPLPEHWDPRLSPETASNGTYFVRGGSWWAVENYTRACARSEARSGSRYPNAGFRLLRALDSCSPAPESNET